jgi:hypothetical protein
MNPRNKSYLAWFSARFGLLLFFAIFPVSICTAKGDVDQARELGKYLSQHGYGVMSVDNRGDNNEMVEAEINGKIVSLMIDTGSYETLLTSDCARRLKLDVHDSGHAETGVGGLIRGKTGIALINSFKLDHYEINRTNTIMVLPSSARLGSADGLLGFNFLRLNAVILPVGARMFLFKPGNGPVVPIDHYMQLLGFKAIALHYEYGGLKIEGNLDGHPLSALIDCGAGLSMFDLDYVLKASGRDISSMNMSMQGLDGHDLESYYFTPRHLALGTISIPPIALGCAKSPTFTKEGFNALLGYDVLALHQAILDLGHDTLWMK